MDNRPIALFITWTVYGTFLPGDQRGWMHRLKGPMMPQPKLSNWTADRLNFPIRLLAPELRAAAAEGIRQKCKCRRWQLHAVAVRSNHSHVVVTANSLDPDLIRNQLKAMATDWIREADVTFRERPVWSAKGWIEYVDTDEDLSRVVTYCEMAQERKNRDQLE